MFREASLFCVVIGIILIDISINSWIVLVLDCILTVKLTLAGTKCQQ